MKEVFAFIFAIALAMVIAVIVSIVLAIPGMHLWNWLMPKVFGLPRLNYIQTVGLITMVQTFTANITVPSSGK